MIIGAVVLVIALASAGGRGRGRSRRGGSHGATGTAYVVIGALLGATVLGATVLRSAVSAFITAVTALGGLFR